MPLLRPVETFCQDIRYGLRGLAKSPLLVLVAALSLGLGIGANLMVYSVLKSVLLDSVTASRPDRLLNIRLGRNYQTSYPNYRDLAESKVLAGLAAYIPGLGSEVNWRLGNETKTLSCLIVSANFFQVLGLEAAVGRTFTADEAPAEHNPQWVVLSYGLWQRHLGGDPSIIGRVLNLNGLPYTVLGILPKGHRSVLGHGTLRNTLVIGQMALSLVLLVTALLFLRNLLHILGTNPGFDTKHTLSIYVRRVEHRYTPEQSRLFSHQVFDRLAGIPGVEAASSVSFLPLGFFGWGGEVHKEGESETERFGVGRQSLWEPITSSQWAYR